MVLNFLTLLAMSSPVEPTGTATLPLAEVLELHGRESKPQTSREPPVESAVQRFDIEGRIIGDAIEARAKIAVATFADGWTRVPLLRTASGVSVTELPVLDGAHFVSDSRGIDIVVAKAGTVEFELAFLASGSRSKATWRVELAPVNAVIRRLRVRYDEALFSVERGAGRREGDSLLVLPRRNVLALEWREVPGAAESVVERERTPIEPAVSSARCSVVITLDGQRISRCRYQLSFEGEQDVSVDLPSGHTLAKAYLNGISTTPKVEGAVARFVVTPERAGEAGAVVEIVTKEQRPPLALAGEIAVHVPVFSWGINELDVDVHLPDVFTYAWVGGSLSGGPGDGEIGAYTYQIPTPGLTLHASQELVRSQADGVLNYSVDLDGLFYR